MINSDADDNTILTSDYNAELQEDEFETNNRITIEDINIKTEMNNSQMAIHENKNHEQEIQDVPELENRTNHGYNLRKRPTKRKEMMSLVQTGKITGVSEIVTIHPKIHANIILTQVSVKQGLMQFGKRANEAVLKEL